MTADGVFPAAETSEKTQLFKAAFRRYSAGVSLVTAKAGDRWFGLTASSVASVSADPPMLSFSMPKNGSSAERIAEAASVGIHLLPVGRTDLAEAFARRGGPRFTPDQGWKLDDEGQLYLPDSLATLTGKPQHVLPAGASSLVVLGVRAIFVGPVAEPLTYQDGTFRGLGRPAVLSFLDRGVAG
ncbi:flavin reductase family protein [Aeromicrobium sp. P5_D10]